MLPPPSPQRYKRANGMFHTSAAKWQHI